MFFLQLMSTDSVSVVASAMKHFTVALTLFHFVVSYQVILRALPIGALAYFAQGLVGKKYFNIVSFVAFSIKTFTVLFCGKLICDAEHLSYKESCIFCQIISGK